MQFRCVAVKTVDVKYKRVYEDETKYFVNWQTRRRITFRRANRVRPVWYVRGVNENRDWRRVCRKSVVRHADDSRLLEFDLYVITVRLRSLGLFSDSVFGENDDDGGGLGKVKRANCRTARGVAVP